MSFIKLFFKCCYSPSLYMIYKDHNYTGRYYPDRWEKLGDFTLSMAVLFWKLGLYSSPFLGIMLYRRGFMNIEGAITFTRITLWYGLLLGSSICVRSYGRATNPYYREFLMKFENAHSAQRLIDIKHYDFDFSAWPVEFHLPARTKKERQNAELGSLLLSPCSIIGYIVLHTVGIKMIYPGSIALINYLLSQSLVEGRRALVVEKNGVRYKLMSPDGNIIDSMLIDKRQSASLTGSNRGKILVICTEGNAGFYENGIMGTVIDSGFSVLGWNHPGFSCSTGSPYIEVEESAINTIMEFAIQSLGFLPEEIILYGWSIGGYASGWAASAYPSVLAVVADASFDDVLPLAINHMPSVFESIVNVTIRSFANLNVAKHLVEYPGNIKMVRRADDEIISIIPGDLTTNRGNDLLWKVLKHRYPQVISDETLSQWLSVTGAQQRKLQESVNVNNDMCRRIIDQYINDHGPEFPFSDLGSAMDDDIKQQMTIFLAGEYMVDYASTHCVPLPSTVFLSLVYNLLSSDL